MHFKTAIVLKTLTLTDCGTIGNYSFGGCENLTDVAITNLDVIGEDSFAIHDEGVYSSLTNLTLHNVRYISSGHLKIVLNFTSSRFRWMRISWRKCIQWLYQFNGHCRS